MTMRRRASRGGPRSWWRSPWHAACWGASYSSAGTSRSRSGKERALSEYDSRMRAGEGPGGTIPNAAFGLGLAKSAAGEQAISVVAAAEQDYAEAYIDAGHPGHPGMDPDGQSLSQYNHGYCRVPATGSDGGLTTHCHGATAAVGADAAESGVTGHPPPQYTPNE